MRIRILFGLALLGLLLVAMACGGDEEETTPAPPTATPTAAPTAAPTVAPTAAPTAAPTPSMTAVELSVLQDDSELAAPRFNPSNLTLEVGKTYRITLSGGLQYHTFTVDDLEINQNILPGETETVEITPTKTGTFTLICIPHELLGMVGTITVQ